METQYTSRLERIEAVLNRWLPEAPDSCWLEKVFGTQGKGVSPELAASITRPGRDLLDRGGKRWRPLLMLLVSEAIAGEGGAETALPLTPLVELSHNASLIHDDIEDNSDERRGKPAVHLIYGADTAINAGAFMYFLPLACLSVWGENIAGKANASTTNSTALFKDKIMTAWASHIRALHLGQAMDIAWHRDDHSLPGLDEYDRMCRLKTGCLARLAAILGVYCAGEYLSREKCLSDSDLSLLMGLFTEAAENLGVGFQILDDVKNLGAGVPGKKRGDDIVEGKKSLPVLLYLHRYPEKRDFAAHCFTAARAGGIGAPELDELIQALGESGVLDEARAKGLEYIRKSRDVFSASNIGGFTLKNEGCRLLAGLIDFLV